MYARPELDYAISHLWDLIRKNLSKKGIPAPITLSQDAEDVSSWLDPSLVLSQTCGMPYRNILHGKVQLVGTPQDMRDAMLLKGIVKIPASEYLNIPNPE
jgi:hypothetical protein